MSVKPPHRPPTDPPGEPPDLEAEAASEATAEELARAASLAKLLDRLLAGSPPPAALPAEDRVLLDAATMIHSAHVPAELGARRVNALVAEALDGEGDRGRVLAFPEKLEAPAGDVIDLRSRSRRVGLWVASAFAVAAAAAAVWFFVSARPEPRVIAAPTLPSLLRSRSAGALLGRPIPTAAAADASARLDLRVRRPSGGLPRGGLPAAGQGHRRRSRGTGLARSAGRRCGRDGAGGGAMRRAGFASLVALGVLSALGVASCGRERRPEPGSSSDALGGGKPLDKALMLNLASARAYHHQADVYLADGNTDKAIDAVQKITDLPFPAEAPEAQEALDDAYARLGKLELGAGKVTDALAVVQKRLAEPAAESFFRSNLISVTGELLHERAKQLDASDVGQAKALRKQAIDTFQRAIDMNMRLQAALLKEEP